MKMDVIFQLIRNAITHELELFVDVGESERVHLHAALMSAKDFIEASIFHRSKVKVIERLEQAWIQYLKEDLKLLLE